MKLIPPNITPGPWSSYKRLVESPHVFVAKCHNLTDGERCGDTEANARAIAATPDTLAALAAFPDFPDDFHPYAPDSVIAFAQAVNLWREQARAALLKAGYLENPLDGEEG